MLLKYVKQIKTLCEYNAIDFEADLASMYTEVRRCMAIDYPDDFGLESIPEPVHNIKDMTASEYAISTRPKKSPKKQRYEVVT